MSQIAPFFTKYVYTEVKCVKTQCTVQALNTAQKLSAKQRTLHSLNRQQKRRNSVSVLDYVSIRELAYLILARTAHVNQELTWC